MRTGKNIPLYIMPTKLILIFIVFSVTLYSCRKETNTSKLSSKNCYVLPSTVNMNGYFVCDGEPGFFVSTNETINVGPGNNYSSQSKLTRIGLNTAIGIFSESLLAFDPPLPKFTTRFNTITQLKPNSNSFILNSKYTCYGAGSGPFSYTKLFLTDKTLSSPKEFELPDSSVTINSVEQMPDGRFAVSSTKGIIKSMSGYNSTLQRVWTQTAEFGALTKDYINGQILATSKYIYILQPTIFFSRAYRILVYDCDGKKISYFEYAAVKRNQYAAGQLIESPNGFYIIGTKYLPEKSEYDIHVSTMSPASKLAEHVWNITDYLPDWSTATRNVFNTYFSGSSGKVIKTAKGYAYTLAYPDSKDQCSLAFVLLNNEMKVESVKVIAKNVGNGFGDPANENLSLLNDENHLYIMWKQGQNNYFYVLDMEGNLVR